MQVNGTHISGQKFKPGSTIVTWNATDSSGNTATTNMTVHIYDNIRKKYVNLANVRFNGWLEQWEYAERPHSVYNQLLCDTTEYDVYNLTYSAKYGGTAFLNYTDACWQGTAGMTHKFVVPHTHHAGSVSISLSHRSLADTSDNERGTFVNNAYVMITDHAGKLVKFTRLYGNATATDSGWLNKTITLRPADSPKCTPCEIYVHVLDAWPGQWKRQLYIDNVTIIVSPGVTGVSDSPLPPSYSVALDKNDLFRMQADAGNRILISELRVSADSVLMQWEPFTHDAKKYRVVLHPAGQSADKITILTDDTWHRFDGLDPDTEYVLRVRVAGDHSTQTPLDVRTADR